MNRGFRKVCYGLLTSFVAQLLVSCVQVPMYEVGPDSDYFSHIGRTIKVKEDVWILGISLKNKPPVDYYVLVGGVGFSGREVVFRDRVKKGISARVTKVLSDDSVFFSRMTYVAKLIEGDKHSGMDVKIRLIHDKKSGQFVLDNQFFEVTE